MFNPINFISQNGITYLGEVFAQLVPSSGMRCELNQIECTKPGRGNGSDDGIVGAGQLAINLARYFTMCHHVTDSYCVIGLLNGMIFKKLIEIPDTAPCFPNK